MNKQNCCDACLMKIFDGACLNRGCTCHSPKTTDSQDWEERFDDAFVRIDHGPDADDHDCEPDEWNDRAKMGDESDQIDRIKQFIRETRTAAYESGKESVNQTDQFKEGRASVLREAFDVLKLFEPTNVAKNEYEQGYFFGQKQIIKALKARLLDT